MLTPDSEARNECPDVPLVEKEPRQSSELPTYALSLAAAFVIFGALGFGLMMINKEAVEVDHHLNGKYKSMQFARERIQTGSNKEAGDLDDGLNEGVGDGDLEDYYADEVLDGNLPCSDYPDDPKFRLHSHESSTGDVNPDTKHDDFIDYPDDPQFRPSFV